MNKPDDIKEMENKIEAFKSKRKAEKISSENKQPDGSFAKGFQFSIDLISGVFIGAAIGYFLDIVFKTKPICLAILTVFGGAAGILNIYKSVHAEDEEQ